MTQKQNRFINLGLMLAGTLMALLIGWGIISLLPTAYDRQANTDLGVIEFQLGMGDLFFAESYLVRPPDDPTIVLSRHRLAWDDDGFRVPAQPAQTYDILVLGDSYTEATNVALPYPDVLAELTGKAVRNLGFRGYGPLDVVEIAQEFADGFAGDALIVGVFGGNDIANLQNSLNQDVFDLPTVRLADQTTFSLADAYEPSDDTDYIYPVTLDIGGEQVDVAFLNGYIREHNIRQEDLLQSIYADELVQSWQDIQSVVAEDTCVIIAYLPSRPELYLEHIIEEDQRRIIFPLRTRKVLDEATLTFVSVDDVTIEYDELIANMPAMRQGIAQLAQENGFAFVDVTQAMQTALPTNGLLHYAYDTHPNQRGHDVMAQAIADYLATNPCG
jgi:hypothetical protein